MTANDEWQPPFGPPRRATTRPGCSVILPQLLVGEYPTPADAVWLRHDQGVDTVVNLQDEGDLASKGLRVADLEAAYRANNIVLQRVPITDCDNDMLRARLTDAVRHVELAMRDGQRVYLHCNAGLNRAPTVAIAFLYRHQALSLDAARDFVKQRRHCIPYMTVLRQWTAGGREGPAVS